MSYEDDRASAIDAEFERMMGDDDLVSEVIDDLVESAKGNEMMLRMVRGDKSAMMSINAEVALRVMEQAIEVCDERARASRDEYDLVRSQDHE